MDGTDATRGAMSISASAWEQVGGSLPRQDDFTFQPQVQPQVPDRNRHTQPSLRTVLAASFGALGLIATLASSLAVGRIADRRIRADIGAEFAAAAERVADLLDRGLFERLRDVQVAASLDAMTDREATPAARQAMLRRLQDTYPDYAILFFINPDGRVQATSSGILMGADVSKREYFREGLERPFVADVHEALLMAPLLGRAPENPPRFVDLSAPVRAADGTLVGVVGAHLFWEWAEGIERDVMAPLLARHPGAEALVLSRDGQVLLGPSALRTASLAKLAPNLAHELAAGRTGSKVEIGQTSDAPANRTYLVGYAATHGHRTYPGLGWTVLVRRDAEAAFAPARKLVWEVSAWGIAAAAIAAALGWLLAGVIARPLADLCETADRLKGDPEATEVPVGRGPREIVLLSSALAALVAGVRWREAALRDGEARLRHATEGAGIGTWELDLASGTGLSSPRHGAIFGHSEPLTKWNFDTFVDQVVPEDRTTVALTVQNAIAAGLEWRSECRITRSDDGEERWIEIRGVPLRAPIAGAAPRYSGVVEDVTGRKQGEQALQLLVRELDHRVKNQFAIFDGLVQFTARTAQDSAAMARVLRGRVSALASAHDLVRDASGDGRTRGLRSSTLSALTEAVISPFSISEGGDSHLHLRRVRHGGAHVEVGPVSASALALVLHELSTNAARHGALSSPTGMLEVSWSAAPEGKVCLLWKEAGGPAVTGEPERRGFGTTLIHQSAKSQLGGTIRFDWTNVEGLLVVLELPASRLAR
ncbi:HWE histidine kinase domain-containing protein [Muricoccus aerilatus]|uniref:HWE histidine kinase domain-containing protein n=1 Tax=Muricoccus aerilatus TaxID=452982 RepID=UPI0009FEDBAA|nr:HWE histidine kinase domain-containing protein [Roseomonas aerilata]